MKYSQAALGRVFILRLEDGEILHELVEQFAREKAISSASLMVIGGAGRKSRLVVGPKEQDEEIINPMEYMLDNAHEIVGVGTIFPDESGKPVSHIHLACGRKDYTRTGCARRGVRVWLVAEVVIFELVGSNARRKIDSKTKFELLEP